MIQWISKCFPSNVSAKPSSRAMNRRSQRTRGSATTGGCSSVAGQRGRTERHSFSDVWSIDRLTMAFTTTLLAQSRASPKQSETLKSNSVCPFRLLYVWVAFLRSLASTKDWEQNISSLGEQRLDERAGVSWYRIVQGRVDRIVSA